jgi:hypothetical protein
MGLHHCFRPSPFSLRVSRPPLFGQLPLSIVEITLEKQFKIPKLGGTVVFRRAVEVRPSGVTSKEAHHRVTLPRISASYRSTEVSIFQTSESPPSIHACQRDCLIYDNSHNDEDKIRAPNAPLHVPSKSQKLRSGLICVGGTSIYVSGSPISLLSDEHTALQ